VSALDQPWQVVFHSGDRTEVPVQVMRFTSKNDAQAYADHWNLRTPPDGGTFAVRLDAALGPRVRG
jgi:hypothetical protein